MHRTKTEISNTAAIIWIALTIAALAGWVMNLVTLFGSSAEFTGEIILRVIGTVVFPIGAVMGWL